MKIAKVPQDDTSRFSGDTELKGGEMRGIYHPSEAYAVGCVKYSVSEQMPTAPYRVRGTVSVLDETGHVLRIRGKKQSCTLQLQSTESSAIRAEIVKKSVKLLAKCILIVIENAEKSETVDRMRLAVAIAMFLNGYVKDRSRSSIEMQKKRSRIIKAVGIYLGQERIGSISNARIAAFCREIGESWSIYINEAASFIDFVSREKLEAEARNPFRAYLEKNAAVKARNTTGLQAAAANTDILSYAEAQKLYRELAEHIGNGELFAVAIIAETGLATKEVSELKWSSVIWLDEDHTAAKLAYHRDNLAGSVHDYSFPLFPSGSRILAQRYDWLKAAGFSDDMIQKLPLVSEADNPKRPLEPKRLTSLCRSVLHSYGVGYARLVQLQCQTVGSGVKMLQQTYQHRLEACGMDCDKALLHFMLHRSLNDSVQASHYRSFTDESATSLILGYLARDDLRFSGSEKPEKGRIIRKNRGKDGETVRALGGNKQRTQVEVSVHLKPGEQISISTQRGCRIALRTCCESIPAAQPVENVQAVEKQERCADSAPLAEDNAEEQLSLFIS